MLIILHLEMRNGFIFTDPLRIHIIWLKNNLRHTFNLHFHPDQLGSNNFSYQWLKSFRLILAKYVNFRWQARDWEFKMHLEHRFVICLGIPGWTHGGIFSVKQPPIWKCISSVDSLLFSVTRRKPIWCIVLSSTDSLFFSPTIQTFLTRWFM